MRPYLLRKLWNAYINKKELKHNRIVLRSLPPIVFVEPTNICNLRCVFCPSGQRQIKPTGKMNIDLFKQVIDELGPTALQLHLYNWGESFLHSQLPEMIKYAKRYGPKIIVSTNFTKLDKPTAKAIINAKLDRVSASIDGVSQKTYEKYRAGGNVELALSNMKMLCSLKQKANSRLPNIDWQFLVSKHNEAELPKAKQIAKEIGVRFRAKRLRVGLDEFDKRPGSKVASEHQGWLPESSQYNFYSKKRKKMVCEALWVHAVISWQGAVAPCCQVFKPSHSFANTFPDNFRSVWNGHNFLAARKLFAQNSSSEAKRLKLVCVGCSEAGNII